MLIIAAALFAAAALGGLAMAFIHFRGDRNPPGALAALHGVAAAAALLVLLWAVIQSGGGGPVAWALGLFVVAALGGFFLLSFHLRRRRLPSAGVLVHAVVAVAAFVLLLVGIAGA